MTKGWAIVYLRLDTNTVVLTVSESWKADFDFAGHFLEDWEDFDSADDLEPGLWMAEGQSEFHDGSGYPEGEDSICYSVEYRRLSAHEVHHLSRGEDIAD